MKLSKLYSNKPNLFEPIDFVQGLNVVLAEIRLPENRAKDTHNLGKSTLTRLLDFCFLAGRSKNFFLFKHPDLFNEFVFFLEIELADASYITVRRSVRNASKISFKKHEARGQDLTGLSESEWDHTEIPFKRAVKLLDSFLDWRALKPWSYRKGLGYQLRSQDDYKHVFHLAKFMGMHSDWKPFLAHLLGFNAALIDLQYKKEKELEKKKEIEKTIERELGGSIEDISKIEGILSLKQRDAEKKQKLLDAFDFRSPDKKHTKELVDEINKGIASLNTERYSLSYRKKKIRESLEEDQILFNPDDAERLFKQAGVVFHGQIKKDFEQLIAFNRAITNERRDYLQEELSEVDAELRRVNSKLNDLGKQRSRIVAFLSSTDIFDKYKMISDEMVVLRADITDLERQREYLRRLRELRDEIRTLKEEREHLRIQIEKDVEKQNVADNDSLFSWIRIYFSEVVEDVMNQKALLEVSTNRDGHLEFKADILDKSGNHTSADLGHSYRKLLCIAFDLAVLRAHLNNKFPRFVYHDGVFESLDDRKKENLLTIYRNYADLGIQPIITLIDSDMPVCGKKDDPVFDPSEIILTLHDENEQGQLFKMKSW